MPKQPGGFPPPPTLPVAFARAIFGRAAKGGKLTADGLVAAAEKLFEACDKDKSGKLEAREISEAIRALFAPRPAVADKTKKG